MSSRRGRMGPELPIGGRTLPDAEKGGTAFASLCSVAEVSLLASTGVQGRRPIQAGSEPRSRSGHDRSGVPSSSRSGTLAPERADEGATHGSRPARKRELRRSQQPRRSTRKDRSHLPCLCRGSGIGRCLGKSFEAPVLSAQHAGCSYEASRRSAVRPCAKALSRGTFLSNRRCCPAAPPPSDSAGRVGDCAGSRKESQALHEPMQLFRASGVSSHAPASSTAGDYRDGAAG